MLGYALQYRVYVPDGAPGQALPTLYVTDGAWYLEQGRMQAVLDEMIAAGRIAPVIAVFVDARERRDAPHRGRRVPPERPAAAAFEVSQGHNWNNWGPLLPEVLLAFYGRQ